MKIREHNRTDKPYVDFEYQEALERIRELLSEEQEKYGSTSLLGDRLVNTISEDDLIDYGIRHFDMDENVPLNDKEQAEELLGRIEGIYEKYGVWGDIDKFHDFLYYQKEGATISWVIAEEEELRCKSGVYAISSTKLLYLNLIKEYKKALKPMEIVAKIVKLMGELDKTPEVYG
jgi:hypothetical protein